MKRDEAAHRGRSAELERRTEFSEEQPDVAKTALIWSRRRKNGERGSSSESGSETSSLEETWPEVSTG